MPTNNTHADTPFGMAIAEYMAAEHPDLLQKEGKSIDKCCDFILIKVKDSGRQGFADQEIFDLAVEYYRTENTVIGTAPSARVVVNKAIAKPEPKAKPKAKPKPDPITQQSLF